jgi:hypothetical protein
LFDPADVDAMHAAATKQASLVRQLKKDGAPAAEIEAAVAVLKQLRVDLEAAVAVAVSNEPAFNRKGESLQSCFAMACLSCGD